MVMKNVGYAHLHQHLALGVLPPQCPARVRPVTRRQRENEERALLYVSLTRAPKLAFVFGYGQMSEWF